MFNALRARSASVLFEAVNTGRKGVQTTAKRFFRINHFTSEENIRKIKASKKLIPGPGGNLGQGVYFTPKTPPVFSNEEIATSIRRPSLPFDDMSHFVSLDTDDLDKAGISWKKTPSGNVFLPRKDSLDLTGIPHLFDETPRSK